MTAQSPSNINRKHKPSSLINTCARLPNLNGNGHRTRPADSMIFVHLLSDEIICLHLFPNRSLLLRVLLGIKERNGHTRGEAVSALARPRIAVAVPKIIAFMYKTSAFFNENMFKDNPQCFFFAKNQKSLVFEQKMKQNRVSLTENVTPNGPRAVWCYVFNV